MSQFFYVWRIYEWIKWVNFFVSRIYFLWMNQSIKWVKFFCSKDLWIEWRNQSINRLCCDGENLEECRRNHVEQSICSKQKWIICIRNIMLNLPSWKVLCIEVGFFFVVSDWAGDRRSLGPSAQTRTAFFYIGKFRSKNPYEQERVTS